MEEEIKITKDGYKRKLRRFAVWSGSGRDAYLFSLMFERYEDAEKFVESMPESYRDDDDEDGAVAWENEEHTIVPVTVECPF